MAKKATRTYSLSGRVSSREGEPIPNLTVRAYDQDPQSSDNFLGDAVTNEEGRYTIRFTEAQFKPGGKESGGPDVYIGVLFGDKMLGKSPVRRNAKKRVTIDLEVEAPEANAPAKPAFRVGGMIGQPDGRPVAGATVRAFHKNLRTEAPIGETVSDRAGRYAISYKAEDLGRAEKGRANLVVRAFDASNTLLSESPIRFQAKATETINLIVAADHHALSPFERTLKRLGPLLDGATLSDLSEHEIAFLAGESGIAEGEIVRTVMADRAAKVTGLPAGAFHGYLTARQSEQRGALAGFWRRLASDFGIRPEDTARFRFLARAGEMVGYDPPLIEALLAKLNQEEILGALDLALWDADRWVALLKTAWADEELPLPPWAQGRTREEQFRQAAATISDRVARIFPAKTVSAMLVSGRVATPCKRPAADVAVQAFHHDLDREIPISSKALTDPSGGYRIVIDPDILKQRVPSLNRLPLQLRLLACAGDEASPVGQTEIIHGATLPLALDITVTRETGPTEFNRVADLIRGALGDTPPEKMAPDRLNWLAGATALDIGTTQRYVHAHKLAEGTTFPAEALYGFLHPAIEPTKRSDHETVESRLRRAVATGLVGESVLQYIDAVEAWVRQREIDAREREIAAHVAELNKPGPEGRPARPVDIVRAARLPSEALDAFIRLAAEHPTEDAAALQKRLAEAGVAARERATVRTALRLAEMVGPNAALVGALMQALPPPADPSEADPAIALLARWSAETWARQLQSLHREQPAPEVARQARAIQARMEGFYPIEALLGRLEEHAKAREAPGDAAGDLRPAVDLNPLRRALEGRRDIDLRGKGLKFQDLHDVPEPVRQDLEKLQRLARVASFGEAITLLEMGYASARDIAVTPTTRFVDKFAQASRQPPAAGEEESRRRAREIHHRAAGQAAAAVATAGVLTPALWATDPAAIGGSVRRPVGGASATMEKLFGAFDACSVAPCESVLGLPAYLVDLLELMENAADDRHPNPKAVLEQRRPDIFHLELSCANAETLLPAIDLVIELLEDHVAPVRRQVNLREIPKGLGKLAPILSAGLVLTKPTSTAPEHHRQTTWSSEELLAYPEYLNAAAYNRLKSEETLFPWTLPFSLPHEEAETYLEDLGTGRAELMRQLHAWPLSGDSALELASADLGLNPAARRIILGEVPANRPWRCWGYANEPAGWPASIGADAKALLARTGLTYADLIELLATNYINPGRAIDLELAAGADACDLAKASLKTVDAPFLSRFHRFARLWLHLGCSVRELDRAVSILGGGDIGEGLLLGLADARRLASRLSLPLAAVLPFWGDIDTEAGLNRAADPIARKPSQYETLLLDKSRLSQQDRRRLALPFAQGIDLEGLIAPVGSALGLSAADRALLMSPNAALGLSEAAVTADEPLPLISALYRWQTLAQALALPICDLLRLRALSGINPFESPASCLRSLDALQALQRHGLSLEELDWTLHHVAGPEPLSRFEDGGRKFLRRVKEEATKQAEGASPAEAMVKPVLCREVARLCGLSNDAVETVLSHIWVSAPEPRTGLALLTAWIASTSLADVALSGPAWDAYVRLMKSARLYARMNLGGQALKVAADAALSPLRLLAPNALPAAADVELHIEARRQLFDGWLALAALADLQHRMTSKQVSLWDIHQATAGAASPEQSWATVAEQLGDERLDVAALIGPEMLALDVSAADAAPATWLRFLDASALVQQLGMPTESLARWTADDLDLATSAAVRAAAAARRTPEEWRARAPQLRQGLRVKQRAALLAWARVNPLVADLNELHAEYLIDLETGPQQSTTRMAQATAAVQRFVQRALLGIERAGRAGPVVLPPDFADTWEWMKSYPAWANARKVFLYPENFLTPEIRDDKSSFFVDLEQQLSQRALNDETIEDAVGQYLQKLDEVARLETMGSCTEVRNGEKLMHIVARTRGVPHGYFHRTWNIAEGGFTPWVKLDLDIDGDWVIPVVFNGRLTLYWVKHTKQLEGMADIVGQVPTRPFPLSPHYPMPQDQYTLSWSTRQRKGWSKKQVAKRPIARPLNPLMPAHFAVRLDPDRLRIAGVTLLPQLPPAPGKILKPKFRSFRLPSIPTEPPPGMSPAVFVEWVKGILDGVYRWRDWIWKQVDGVWQWVEDSVEDVQEEAEEVAVSLADLGSDAFEVLGQILEQLQSFQQDVLGKLNNLPRKVWSRLASELGRLADKAWDLLPSSIREILCLIKDHIDKVVDVLTKPDIQGAPLRVLQALIDSAGQFVSSIATMVGEFLRMVKHAGLTQILGADLIQGIGAWFESVISGRPGWAGPVPGFEFGFFDVGEGGARALRLTPPPFLMSAGLGAAGLLATGAAVAPVPVLMLASLGPALLTVSPLLATGLIAMSESARLIYSMFPGYPAFYDIPVLSGVLSTDLPLMSGSASADDRVRAWPGSGFSFIPQDFKTLGLGDYCTIAVNLQNIALEEMQDLNFPLAAGFAPTLDGVRNLANGVTGFLEGLADTLVDPAALLNVSMRLVRPLPLGTYPGRLYKPSPTIIGEDRHSRNFLLHQAASKKGKHVKRTWHVISLYHPLTSVLSRSFDREGVEGLYASASRPTGEAWRYGSRESAKNAFANTFSVISPFAATSPVVAGTAAQERLDLSMGGAYSLYNWELLFHIPVLIAGRLARQQSFSQALAWYRKVFDPTATSGSSPQRFWRFKQFHDEYADAQPYQTLLAWLTELAEGSENDERAQAVAAWRRDPFNAHRVARMRAGTYPRWVVMRTVETLINWGDARFREGSWEAVNEATQLYFLAQEILGPRPQLVPARHAQTLTYQQLADRQGQYTDGVDPFGNALLAIEATQSPLAILDDDEASTGPSMAILSGVSMLYFGIPANERLLKFWETIADRLLKIRSGLDLKGQIRNLLPTGVSAAGSAVPGTRTAGQMTAHSLASATRVPLYRFQLMLQKAYEFVGEVKAFGAALLAAAEKRDAEELGRLRAGHENSLLEAMRRVRELQIVEAERALAAAERGREGAQIRLRYYGSREFINAAEMVKEALMGVSLGLSAAAATSDAVAAILSAIPQVKIEGSAGTDTSGKAAIDTGGLQASSAASATARVLSALSSLANAGSSMAGSIASYQRRQEEWDHQAQLAENDLEQFDQQIAGANARLAIARRELENHEQQIANAREISDYLHDKFTNQELYEWMLEQAAMLHFQSYLLAVDVARQTEGSFHYERMPLKTTFLAFEQWNDLGGALMAGERLQHDLRRMEKSFLDLNTREIEITKHISLAQVDPVALLLLRQNGECFVSLPEHLFDKDHPGHYLRRIKSVSLSIPSVVGPYTSINCRLSLVRSEIRVSPNQNGYADYPRERNADSPDARFVDVNAESVGSSHFVLSPETAAMVTSHAQSDSGLFETNLRDERYLPFEGAGAISTWRIELPKETNRFDPATISDVVIHLRYTARDGGPELREHAWKATFGTEAPTNLPISVGQPQAAPRKLHRLFSARHDFSDAWHRFLHPVETQQSPVLDLDLSRDRFPYYPPELSIVLKTVTCVFVTDPAASAEGLVARLNFVPGGGGSSIEATPTNAAFAADPDLASLAACEYTPADGGGMGLWQLRIAAEDNTETIAESILDVDAAANTLRLAREKLLELFVLCLYELET